MVSVKRIVSICPKELKKQMPLGLGLYTFVLQPQERNSYEILTITDSYQLIRTGFDELSDSNPTPSLAPAPVSAHVLASSLVAEWNRTIAPVGSMGVRVMPDDMQEGTPEFNSFLRAMSGELRALAEWAVRDANDKAGNNEARHISDGFHRVLARWLYTEEGARVIPWYNASAIDELKKCLACGVGINANAKVCKECGTDLVEYFVKYNLEDSVDPVVAAMAKRIKMPAQTVAHHSVPTVEPLVRANIPDSGLPDDARAACVQVMSAEQKTEMNTKMGRVKKDEYIVSLIPDLCLKNSGLKAILKAKNYVVSDSD